ncbi:GGDEF domain-containing protein [Pseudoalteromonas sp. H105]|uniref:GGDEF domain-containing protein n=1 Tax=Pseudoalteromonas sp. H105 TaxID=1348393 RepID=UPI00073200C0|nr:GGDEF domain-containing protein [Pseudoalteromonas sp. H105]KTF16633.1 hypothetical protein ATS75_04065 [Pseudoalteromonas sp. H105]
MKHPYWLAIIWLFVLVCSIHLLNSDLFDMDLLEELFWAALSVSLTLQVYAYLGNKLLITAWVVYCTGLILDLLDDLVDTEIFPVLLFDTALKNIGFLLTCMGLYLLILEKRKTIKKLNHEIQLSQKLQQQLEQEANHDQLTGLGNRRACFTRFEQLKSHYQRVYYFDLDNFKFANDKYGHQCGDLILTSFAKRLSTKFRQHNCFRLGGDEFIAFCNDDSPNLNELREYLIADMKEFQVSVSIGTAPLCPEQDPDTILHNADQNMYVDKSHKAERNKEPS